MHKICCFYQFELFSPMFQILYEKSNFIVLMWWLTVEFMKDSKYASTREKGKPDESPASQRKHQFTVVEQSFSSEAGGSRSCCKYLMI
jgi:hypothetical protein